MFVTGGCQFSLRTNWGIFISSHGPNRGIFVAGGCSWGCSTLFPRHPPVPGLFPVSFVPSSSFPSSSFLSSLWCLLFSYCVVSPFPPLPHALAAANIDDSSFSHSTWKKPGWIVGLPRPYDDPILAFAFAFPKHRRVT